ncbi:MAG: polysaccharide biosynthesis C-terminal domain-containing protein, partial [Pseudomonadota bacterium]
DHTVIRFAAPLVLELQYAALRRLAYRVLLILFCSSAAISTLVLGAGFLYPTIFGGLNPQGIIWMPAIIAAGALLLPFSAFFRAAEQIFESQFYQQLVRSVALIAVLGIAAYFDVQINVATALAFTALTTAFALALLLGHFGRAFSGDDRSAAAEISVRTLLGMGSVTVMIAIFQQTFVQGNVVFLGLLSTPEQAAHYSVAARLSVFVTFGLSALASITAPMIVNAFHEDDRERLRRIATTNARLAFCGAGIVALILAAVGKTVLDIFGPGFSEAYPTLLLLLVGGLVTASGGACANLLLMTGRQKDVLFSVAGGAVVLAIANITFTPGSGAVGGAVASGLALTFSNVAMVTMVYRAHGLDATLVGYSFEGRAEIRSQLESNTD